MDYIVHVRPSDEGVAVWCPGLPGCASQGATEEEALENIKDAIKDYLVVAAEILGDAEVRVVTVVIKDVA